MLQVRRSQERGVNQLSWLFAWHTFSFGEYQDPSFMGFRALRVINEDTVSPSGGFAPHGHKNMEILTYVLEGKLRHQDTLGHEGELKHGTIQLMSAGTGIRHSEVNGSDKKPLHLLQIWLYPEKDGLAPSYTQKDFPLKKQPNRLHLLAAPEGKDALTIRQDARIYAGIFEKGMEIPLPLKRGRYGWLQLARGSIQLGAYTLEKGDGIALSEEDGPSATILEDAEFLFFDLA
jgi:redox-sensitive bicupin YhaK (pirin superfamily)